jgi:CheY-like chemotaxis protein
LKGPTLPLLLVAEDQPDDVFLLRLALQKATLKITLFEVRDGQEAVDYLAGEGPYADRQTYPLPNLFLLDLKMPRMNGFDVLAWLEGRPDFDQLPIVVLSSSNLEQDVQMAKEFGVDDFRVKPVGIENLVRLLQELSARWLDGE